MGSTGSCRMTRTAQYSTALQAVSRQSAVTAAACARRMRTVSSCIIIRCHNRRRNRYDYMRVTLRDITLIKGESLTVRTIPFTVDALKTHSPKQAVYLCSCSCSCALCSCSAGETTCYLDSITMRTFGFCADGVFFCCTGILNRSWRGFVKRASVTEVWHT